MNATTSRIAQRRARTASCVIAITGAAAAMLVPTATAAAAAEPPASTPPAPAVTGHPDFVWLPIGTTDDDTGLGDYMDDDVPASVARRETLTVGVSKLDVRPEPDDQVIVLFSHGRRS